MHDLTDEQTVEQFCFNIQWHFALNITGTGDAAAYVCPRSIWGMRRIMVDDDTSSKLFPGIADHLGKVFEVDTSLQRIDSVHLFSNMRHLGRIRLFATTIHKFLVNLKRHHRELYEALPEVLRQRYLTKRPESLFAMVKPSDSSRTLEELGQDIFFLTERFSSHPEVATMTSFGLLTRLLAEQCRVTDDPETKARQVELKPNCEVPSDSLQNPSDPDAGYDGHKGQGYQAQVAETYYRRPETEEKQEEESPQLRLITHIEVEPANQSDVNALIPFLEDADQRDILPQQVLADSLYGSDANTEAAAAMGTQVIAPAMPATGTITLADFSLADDGTATACPQGHAPKQIKHKGERLVAVFASENCNQCPSREDCPVKQGKRGYYLRYDHKAAAGATTGIRKNFRTSVTATAIGPGSRPPCRSSIDEPESSTSGYEG